MPIPSNVASFWESYCASVGSVGSARFYEAFHFSDSQEQADSLAQLVLVGVKRATAASLSSFEAEGRRPPIPADLSVVTDWSGLPLCLIETTRVDIMPFGEVTAEFAALEGEGDGSLAYWRDVHREYFSRECARCGRTFTESTLVLCERFDVIFKSPS